jgi:hypothetical protein
VVATCSANAVVAGCTQANMVANSLAWNYKYDADGHQVLAVPPHNAVLTALDETATIYDSAGGRVSSIVSCPATSSSCTTAAYADRHTDATYDALGRATAKTVYLGTGTGSQKLASSTVYDGVNGRVNVPVYGHEKSPPLTAI